MSEEKKKFEKIAFIASPENHVQETAKRLTDRYGFHEPTEADAIVALGGDGLMLQTLHRFLNCRIPIYGMNCGSVGFLMNEFEDDNLHDRLANAEINIIHPLRMMVRNQDNCDFEALAINEVSLFRQTYQAAKLAITVDGKPRMEELICDGVLIATPAGSTAYNLSVRGPILPINAPLLALTPISPFRPRRWRGALLRNDAKVSIEVLEAEKRPVSAVADHTEFRYVTEVHVEEDPSIKLKLMFDPGHALDERILAEQFRF
jgi:NAD+ kinase